jgi:hypothetical protein
MGEGGAPVSGMDMGGPNTCNYWQGFGASLGECSAPVNIGVTLSLTRKRRCRALLHRAKMTSC